MVNARSVIYGSAFFASFILLLWPGNALAYRPFDGTDAAVAEKNEVEIELGPFGYSREGTQRSLVAPSLVLNWGFAQGWEAVLEGSQSAEVGPIAGQRLRIVDTSFSLKHVLVDGVLQDKTGISIATEFGPLLPTINGEPGAGAEWALIASGRSDLLTVHLNTAVAWTRAHTFDFIGGAIFEVHDSWSVRPVFEVIAQEDVSQGFTASGLAGAIWRVREGLSLDSAVRFARTGGISSTEIRMGLTWAFTVARPG